MGEAKLPQHPFWPVGQADVLTRPPMASWVRYGDWQQGIRLFISLDADYRRLPPGGIRRGDLAHE